MKLISVPLEKYLNQREKEFDLIAPGRKALLEDFANYIKSKNSSEINLIFICTHNSRRSHFGQIWAQTAAYYLGVKNIKCYSGGTEATAFNNRAVNAILKAGFNVLQKGEGINPIYEIKYSNKKEPIECFSKVYDDPYNPSENFAVIMTCSHADENCPFIPGAEKRFSLTYDDPKEFDGSLLESEKYDERCAQIAGEMLYAFSLV